jgi:uncharacterized protein YjbI with pentapeptide repeats
LSSWADRSHSDRRSGADLSNANLSGVNLYNANLTGANLIGADIRAANLRAANLSGADIRAANVSGADLRGADIRAANLHDVDLSNANLRAAILRDADLSNANLNGVNLYNADLRDADLDKAHMSFANLSGADLRGANLANAGFSETVFADSNLTSAVGLETCFHFGPSIIDHRTLQQSMPLPIPFLRGIGLPQRLIEYLPSIFNQAPQYYFCFISRSTKDQDFADRIHADLQNKGVRCWFAPHDMPIGGKILDEIDVAIRLRDKVVLILSEHSIKSDWVEDEVTKAFEEERKRNQIMLFPIRLDDAVIDTNEPWAAKLRARHIGDFTCWKAPDLYKKGLERVLRDLAPKAKPL